MIDCYHKFHHQATKDNKVRWFHHGSDGQAYERHTYIISIKSIDKESDIVEIYIEMKLWSYILSLDNLENKVIVGLYIIKEM